MKPLKRSPAPSSSEVASATRMRPAEPLAFGRDESSRYAEMRALLLRYLSPILVDSVLEKSMSAKHLTPAMLTSAALAELTGEIMVGLRLFVGPERLPSLMVELAAILECDE